MAALLAACASTPVAPYRGTAPATETIYVVAQGWHTGIGLATDAIAGPLAALARDFPGARYLVFGWGERDYYMAVNPGSGDLLRALFPGPSVVLVQALPDAPSATFGDADTYALAVSREGLNRLSDYLWDAFARNEWGEVLRIADGPYPASAFYASSGTYDIDNTCNTWTAEALHVAGLPVSAAGVVSAGQVIDRVRGLALH